MKNLSEHLKEMHYKILYPNSDTDTLNIVKMNTRVCAIVYDFGFWTMSLAEKVSMINKLLPVFAMVDTHTDVSTTSTQTELNLSFFDYRLKTSRDISTKIHNKINLYKDGLIPPFTKALMNYVHKSKYTFSTPGHLGGSAFLKSPVGTLFYDFYGSTAFEADVSVSMTELGSLLDHSGPHKEAEEFIAKTFGSDASYIVTNGTSTSNKMVGMFCAKAGDTVVIDRNCHKSLIHLLMMVDVEPIYFKPTRNAYGIIGGIPQREFLPETILQKMSDRNLINYPSYMVVTNSTYDGIFYNVDWIEANTDINLIHFDSAWIAYATFNSIYNGMHTMTAPTTRAGRVIFETQSTHKLLAAFSQSSMIHVNGTFDTETFNEIYMMHTSTSPQYSIVASTEVAAAMMVGQGRNLVSDSIDRALLFRQEIKRLNEEAILVADGWYFDVWQPDTIDPNTPECWPLVSTDIWHGFLNQDDNFNYLDPIKVTILTPGIRNNSIDLGFGIPASIVAAYLNDQGIVVEKTGPYNMLFLFSIGIDESKEMELLYALTAFRNGYQDDLTVEEMIPSIYAKNPAFYDGMTVQTLAIEMHSQMSSYDIPTLMYNAFDVLPEVAYTPYQAFQKLLSKETEDIDIMNLVDRTSAVMILPYPPGIPIIMPGEMITQDSIVVFNFLVALVKIGEQFPGFETDIHGVFYENGTYKVKVLLDS